MQPLDCPLCGLTIRDARILGDHLVHSSLDSDWGLNAENVLTCWCGYSTRPWSEGGLQGRCKDFGAHLLEQGFEDHLALAILAGIPVKCQGVNHEPYGCVRE